MAKGSWEVTIRLQKQGNPVITFASVSESGDVIRSSGLVESKRDLPGFVDSHLAAVKTYEPALHRQSHTLANSAAKSQADEYSHKGEE